MDAFIGEIRSFPFGIVPRGWLSCDGTVLPIQRYTALYSIIGGAWGGDGKVTFALPNLKTLAVMGAGQGPDLTLRTWSEQLGQASVSLVASELAAHTHSVTEKYSTGTDARSNMQSVPTSTSWLSKTTSITAEKITAVRGYVAVPPASNALLEPNTLSSAGGGGAHENRQPYLALAYCICTDGTFPSFD